MKIRRSMLVVPANVPQFVEKARSLAADVVYLDLQDAVAPVDAAKHAARAAAVGAVRAGGFATRELCVRVNSPSSRWFIDDVRAVVGAGIRSIKLTQARGLADVLFAERCIQEVAGSERVEIQLSLDTPLTVMELEDIARRSELVTALWLSTGDYNLEMRTANLGPHRDQSEGWMPYVRGRLVTIARAMGWNAGDIVNVPDPSDLEGVKAAMRRSRAYGFDGTLVLYPRVIPIANEVYGVSQEELDWAKALVSAWRAQDHGPDWDKGMRRINGVPVLSPSYEYASRVLEYAEELSA